MTWFAVSPRPDSLAPPPLPEAGQGVLARGSLQLEFGGPLPDRRRRLFSTAGPVPYPGDLTLWRDTGAGILAEVGPPGGRATARVDLGQMELAQTLRITVTWGDSDRPPRLWVGAPAMIATPREAVLPAPPHPACAALRRAIARVPQDAPDLTFAAASTGVEPVGPMPGLAPDTPVMTASGPSRIGNLHPGDRILARDRSGADRLVPVLAILHHRLPARGAYRPVRLHAPYFGLTADLTLSANEHVTLAGPDVEYLFAEEKVLVQAGHLVSRRTGRFIPVGDTVTWHQILLPGQEQLRLGACTFETLHVGGLRRMPVAHEASLLAPVARRDLPHHALTTFPVLTEFEAATLLDQLSRGSS